MRAWASRHPLILFVALAYALTWAMLPLADRYTVVGILALLGPAAAAVATARICGGRAPAALRERAFRWRVSLRWYLVALMLPLPISWLASVAAAAFGATGPIAPPPLTWIGIVVFVMVLGEEIGWRGFALPLLLRRFGPLGASIAVGVIWAVWHLPLFHMDSMPQHGSPFSAYMIYTVALSIILTRLALRTEGSVVVATLFHGAVNTFIVTNTGATAWQHGWGNALAFGSVAAWMTAAWLRGEAWEIGTEG